MTKDAGRQAKALAGVGEVGRSSSWIRPLEQGAGPLYQQIVGLIEDAMRGGHLAAGDRVPPQRQLASALGVDFTTVTRAYNEARRRGLLSSFSGKGSYIAGLPSAKKAAIDLAMNIPPQPARGNMAELVGAGIREILAHESIEDLSSYHREYDDTSLVNDARTWLRPAVGELASGRVMISAGAQAALFSILTAETRPGDTVLCEALTYPGLLSAARQLHLRVVGVEMDEDGILPDALERAQRSSGSRILYLNPTMQIPTAVTMPESRRKEIAGVLRKLRMTLIEDDPYRFLMDDAPIPLASITGGPPAYYLSSLSKCLWSSLRTCFTILPQDCQDTALRQHARAASTGNSALLSALAGQWIRSGVARSLMLEIQREARSRQTLARKLLPVEAVGPRSGIHLWLPLPAHWSQHAFVRELESRSVLVAASDSFSPDNRGTENAIRVSVGGARSQSELAAGLQTIAALLTEDEPSRMSAFV